MNRAVPYTLIVASLMAGCARLKGEDRAQALLDRPTPSSEQGRASECGRLIAETARQRAIGTDAVAMAEDPFVAVKKREAAARAVQALSSRQDALRCSEFPATADIAPPPETKSAGSEPSPANLAPADADASFDRCFNRCRQYTDRTKEQCFDVCSK